MNFSRETIRKAWAGFGLGQTALAFFLLFAAPALFADDCARDWRRAEDCLRTPGFAQGLGTGVGVIATVLVNGAAIATIVLSPPQTVSQGASGGEGGDGQPQDPPKQYFLNILTQDYRTSLKTDGQDSLWVYAQVSCSDPNVDTTGLTAAVHFHAAGDNAAWLIPGAPTRNGGYAAIEVRAQPPAPGAQLAGAGAAVVASTMIEGTVVSGTVPLQLASEVQLSAWAGGKSEASITYDKASKEWRVPSVVVYFHNAGDEAPVQPPFKFGFPDPAFTTEPPGLLALEDCASPDGISYTFDLKIADPTELERQFGPNLDQNNGGFPFTVTAIDENQKEYKASVQFLLSPTIVALYWGFEQDARARAEKRTYKEREFGEFEFVADAEDELQAAVIFVRGDKIEEGADPADLIGDAVAFVRLTTVEIGGTNTASFEIAGDAPKDGAVTGELFELKVKSSRALLHTPDVQNTNIFLRVTGTLSEQAAKQYRQSEVTARIPLTPRFLFLKLLAVPGDEQGTSLAVAYVGTQPGTPQPLRGVTCLLDVQRLGNGPWLSLEGDSGRQTNEFGVAIWTLRYRGMTWANIPEARFKIRAAIQADNRVPDRATYCEIDVGANGREYLSQLTANAARLELGNPAMRSRSRIGDWLWPDSLSGPLNNLCALIGKGPPEHYTCGQLRDRIWKYTIERRFSSDPELAAKMNGLDFGKYEIAPIHVYFGLNPAGTEDPYFIDPWWDQAFNPDKVVLTYTSEVTKLGACVTLLLAGGAAILVAMGVTGTVAAAGAAIKSWLTYGLGGAAYLAGEASYYVCGYGFHIGKTPLSGEPWMNGNGTYREAPSRWGESYFKGAAGERLKTGTISPLENW